RASLQLVGLGFGADGVGVELVDVVEEVVGDEVLGGGLGLDDALGEEPVEVGLVVGLDVVAPALAVDRLVAPVLGAGVEGEQIVLEGGGGVLAGGLGLREDLPEDANGGLGVGDGEHGAHR